MRRIPLKLCLTQALILLRLALAQCKEPSLEARLVRLLRSGQKDRLLTTMRQNPSKVRDVLGEQISQYTRLEKKGAFEEARILVLDTRELAREFDLLTHDGYRRRVELRAGQSLSERLAVVELDQQREGVRDALRGRRFEEALERLAEMENANRKPADLYIRAALHHNRGQALQSLHLARFAVKLTAGVFALEIPAV